MAANDWELLAAKPKGWSAVEDKDRWSAQQRWYWDIDTDRWFMGDVPTSLTEPFKLVLDNGRTHVTPFDPDKLPF